ncbi:hypothetical protein J0383_07950 [Flavobacterium endoglycinae]|uniref:Uncharacterized protein n=1 Tax=Flavobacterium endoglycinae TaxID=2816357 RepID=A0ABX7QI81_9FLAO|nr:hypothetical protein [Flavobacterium endoglycinae]QSW90732.1 hypothetical protein J0383_07950 [Flavobacterium endoglycinae]
MLKIFDIKPIARSEPVSKSRKKRSSFDNRRYKLHQKVKDICELKSKQRTIIVHYAAEISNRYIIELQTKFHYNIQSEMFNTKEIEVIEPIIINN